MARAHFRQCRRRQHLDAARAERSAARGTGSAGRLAGLRGAMKAWAMILLLCGCGGGGTGDLSPDEVTHLPDGNGKGSAANGTYAVEIYVSECQGTCSYRYAGNLQSVCDIGQRQTATLQVSQQDGHLRVEPEGSELVLTRLDGGIWSDGHFDIGGLATQLGGAVVITARATGTIDGSQKISGQARARAVGKVSGSDLDCTAAFDLSGAP